MIQKSPLTISHVKLVEGVKVLGAYYMNSKLYWESHIDCVCTQLNKALYAIL